MSIPRLLSIAGSDSGGGAGIQADLKTFAALDVFGMTAITAVTAQNTNGVSSVFVLPAAMVAQQIDVVAEDLGVDAVKTGMLANAEIVDAVASAFERFAFKHVVVDPVMVATSGDALLKEDAVDELKARLLPRANLVTPNIPEAEVLSGVSITDEASIQNAARIIQGFGASCVLVKGGHAPGRAIADILYDGNTFQAFRSERIDTRNTHGTGCTLSAAIAAYLARGSSMNDAISLSIDYVQRAISGAFPLGSGAGPLNHMHR